MVKNVRVIEAADKKEAARFIVAVGADRWGTSWMSAKAVHRLIQVSNVGTAAANILKQEMLSRGGEAAVHRGVINASVDKSEVLLMGTIYQFEQLCRKIKAQPFGLDALSKEITTVLKAYETKSFSLNYGNYTLKLGERTLVMGILNVTPDSFSDGGQFYGIKTAIDRAHRMVEEGADIIDVGGESTRPSSELVSADEEWERLCPVLKQLVKEVPVPISIDTYKAPVARKAADLGVNILNDVWGLKYDPELARVAAEYELPLVLMHNQQGTEYKDLLGDIISSLRQSIQMAEEAGVPGEKLIIDPGIGFGKDLAQNLDVMRRLRELRSLGKPVLLGTSRKSMIGKTLDLPVTERVEGTAATVACGIMQGVDIVRVHDVKEMVRVVRMTDAIVRRPENEA